MSNPDKQIFKSSSKTFYYSTRFFPKRLRHDLSRLYSFLRLTDTYAIDEPEKVVALEKEYQKALKEDWYDPTTHGWDEHDTRIVKNIMRLTQRYKFEPAWVQSFFEATKSNIKPKAVATLDQALEYVHGSAEVVSLMVAKVLKLPEEAWEHARVQGRAMQWLDFIRDIKEDTDQGRQYFPAEDLKKYGLADLKEETARANPEGFKKFIHFQLKRYRGWQAEADQGQEHLPKRYRIPVQTAVEMFNWTADTIEKNPFVVYKKKVNPISRRVLVRGFSKKSKEFSKDAAVRSKIVGKATAHHSKSLYRLARKKLAAPK